jgi:hypothetical protein
MVISIIVSSATNPSFLSPSHHTTVLPGAYPVSRLQPWSLSKTTRLSASEDTFLRRSPIAIPSQPSHNLLTPMSSIGTALVTRAHDLPITTYNWPDSQDHERPGQQSPRRAPVSRHSQRLRVQTFKLARGGT